MAPRLKSSLWLIGALMIGFGLGLWLRPAFDWWGEESKPPRELKCLPDSSICVGKALTEGRFDLYNDMVLSAVWCEPRPGYESEAIFSPKLIERRCDTAISGVSFRKGQRYYFAFVENGRITRIKESPSMSWAL